MTFTGTDRAGLDMPGSEQGLVGVAGIPAAAAGMVQQVQHPTCRLYQVCLEPTLGCSIKKPEYVVKSTDACPVGRAGQASALTGNTS